MSHNRFRCTCSIFYQTFQKLTRIKGMCSVWGGRKSQQKTKQKVGGYVHRNYYVIWFELLFPSRCQLLLNYMWRSLRGARIHAVAIRSIDRDTYFQLLPHSIRTKLKHELMCVCGPEWSNKFQHIIVNFTKFQEVPKSPAVFVTIEDFLRKLMLVAKTTRIHNSFALRVGSKNHYYDNDSPEVMLFSETSIIRETLKTIMTKLPLQFEDISLVISVLCVNLRVHDSDPTLTPTKLRIWP